MTEQIAAEAGAQTQEAGNNATDESQTPPPEQVEQTTPPEQQAAAPEVPESYEFQMPEGIEVDKVAADEFTAIAKELKLSAEDAQKVADVGAKMAQRQIEAHSKLVESWVEQVKTDKEIGGDKLNENLGIARKALDEFFDPGVKELLNSTGLGNHPLLIKGLYKMGKAIGEDRFVSGKPAGSTGDVAKTMFPNMN